ncbi:MAG: hypothetical protein PHU64_01990 [Candidatus Omnitrophica bacterium]|nr:hypothetical protein [Candidatus Omnitrophota bacterium]MDD5429612.1 hypothetical protein [Candidatus Omnitrophota bacterium]
MDNLLAKYKRIKKYTRGIMGHRQWFWNAAAKGVVLFLTNRCNSKCRICGIWQEEPKKDMPVDMVKSLLKSRLIIPEHTVFVIQGGEAILHPRCGEILTAIQKKVLVIHCFPMGSIVTSW